MSADIELAVQKAWYEAIDAAVTADVVDYVDPRKKTPYVTLNNQFSVPDDRIDQSRQEFFSYVTVWSSYRGQREVLQIIGQIRTALHLKTFPLDAGEMVETTVTRGESRPDVDDRTYQGTLTIRGLIRH